MQTKAMVIEMNRKPYLIFCVMAGLLLLGSCGGDDTQPNETDASVSDETTAAVTEMSVLDFLPEIPDYQGETVNIMQAQWVMNENDNEITYPLDEITAGDIVAEAVYERTRMAEEALNVKITSTYGDWGDGLVDLLRNTVLADTHEFAAVCGRLETLTRVATNGYLADLRSMETLGLDHPWWDANVNRSLTLGGKQLFATGDINYYDDYSIICIAFNKAGFEDMDLTVPYDAVRQGTWTFDEFYKLVHNMGSDVNGDGQYDEQDFYGFIADNQYLGASLIGFGLEMTVENADGSRILNRTEALVERAVALTDAMWNDSAVLLKERKWQGMQAYEMGDPLFPRGQALMSNVLVGSLVEMRGTMEDDFGVLPFPKWNSAQEDYYHTINFNWASAIAVPFNCDDFERTGYILDVLGALSPDTVTEAVIDKNVTVKSTRDEDSADMLELIFKTKVIDPAFVFDWEIGGIWRDMITHPQLNIASSLERCEKRSHKKIENFMEALEALDY